MIINRYGIGDDRVESYCAAEGIPIVLRIPFSRAIASLYSKGIPFVKELAEWRDRFIVLYEALKKVATS